MSTTFSTLRAPADNIDIPLRLHNRAFNVVANEIKELARQTADATQEIKEKINGIQSSTNESALEIEEISEVVKNVNEIVSTIASAVEEQSITTREIAENITQASQGINEVNGNIAQGSSMFFILIISPGPPINEFLYSLNNLCYLCQRMQRNISFYNRYLHAPGQKSMEMEIHNEKTTAPPAV